MSYSGYVTRIKNIRKHSNADRLKVGECFGNQVIVSLDTEENTLGIYFPSDGQLGIEYCEANNLVRKKDENGNNIGGYLDPDKRNIRAIKLRKEISDGLFMPLSSLESFTDTNKLKEGDTITVLNGVEICKKYVPVKLHSQRAAGEGRTSKKKEKRITYPIFAEHRDTSQLMYNLNQFKEGDVCYITLKMHGTSGRTGHLIKQEKIQHKGLKRIWNKIRRKKTFDVTKTWSEISGTRRVVLENYDGGYYGNDDFRKTHHDKFIGKLQKGETVYYEIVGYQSEGRPIMGTVSNEKTQDKEFVKQYGKETIYSYGCENGESDIYIYRMTMTNEDGHQVDYPWDMVLTRAEQMGIKTVPEFDRFIYTTEEDLLERVEKFVGGADPIGRTHVREGVVIRIEGKEKFKAFKHKNFFFKCLEGIIKDAGVIDAEEEASIQEE